MKKVRVVVASFIFGMLRVVGSCNDFLINGNPRVPDNYMTASDVYTPTNRYPYYARLDNTSFWAASIRDANQWIKVQFLDVVQVVGMYLQCSLGNGQVLSFKFDCSLDGSNWNSFTTLSQTTFQGMIIPCSGKVYRAVDSTKNCRYIRIRPQTYYDFVALRMEIIGCYSTTTTTTETSSAHQYNAPISGSNNNMCMDFLINGNPRVPDNYMTASDVFTPTNRYPYYARLDNTSFWAASIRDANQWIKVQFLDIVTVVGIVLQCSLGNGQVLTFRFDCSLDGSNWETFTSGGGELFDGLVVPNPCNSDAYRSVDSTKSCRYIRVRPHDYFDFVALRMEIKGCYSPTTTTITTTTTVTTTTPLVTTTTTSTTTPLTTTTTSLTTSTSTTTLLTTITTPLTTSTSTTTPLTTTTTPLTTSTSTTTPLTTTTTPLTTSTSTTTPLTTTTTSLTTTTTSTTTPLTTTTSLTTNTTSTTTPLTTTTPLATTTTTSASVTYPPNTTVPVCICTCIDININYTENSPEFLHLLDQLEHDTMILSNETSRSKRSKTCATDNRISSKTIGYAGIVSLAGLLASFIFTDIVRVGRFLAQKLSDIF